MLVMKLVNTAGMVLMKTPSIKPSQKSPPVADEITPPRTAATIITLTTVSPAPEPKVNADNVVTTRITAVMVMGIIELPWLNGFFGCLDPGNSGVGVWTARSRACFGVVGVGASDC